MRVSMKELLPALKKTLLFAGIREEDLINMMACLQPKVCHYDKNETIALAGDGFECIGILVRGEAVVMKENAAGSRHVMTMLKPGDLFGEMVVYAANSAWPATVQAREASTVLFLDREKIIGERCQACSWHRTLIHNLLRIISERAVMLNKKVEYLTIRGLRGKLSAFLLDQYKKQGKPDLQLPLNRNELADFLHVSRPSMSRELARMQEDGLITFQRQTVRIQNLKVLSDIVL